MNNYKEFYEKRYDSKIKGYLPRSKTIYSWENDSISVDILSYMKNEKGRIILDIGCGFSSLLNTVTRNNNFSSIGIDISYMALNERKKLFKSEQMQLINADISTLPIKSDTINFVICTHLIEHVPDDLGAIREIYRIIKPGGTLFIMVPNTLSEISFLFKKLQKKHREGGHLREYSFRELKELLSCGGFEIKRIYFSGFFYYWFLFSLDRFYPLFTSYLDRLVRKNPMVLKIFTFLSSNLIFLENRLLKNCKSGINIKCLATSSKGVSLYDT